MSGEADIQYWDINPDYFSKIEAVLERRKAASDLDFLGLMNDLAAHAHIVELGNAVKDEIPEFLRASDKHKFYLCFALLVKYLYPAWEEIETIIQNNIKLKVDLSDEDD